MRVNVIFETGLPPFQFGEHFLSGAIFRAQRFDPSFDLFCHDDFSLASFLAR